MLRTYLLDDEPLAVRRLARMLAETGRAEVVDSSSDPAAAVAWLNRNPVDALFLDIEMPEVTGFEVLARLETPPLVVFTTAYDQYALRAFQANSIDYLLKPVEPGLLSRALNKLERMSAGGQNVAGLLEHVARRPVRLPSRVGERIEFVEVAAVTHFYAKDKLTYAATPAKHHVVDFTIADLEARLEPGEFARIHRGCLVRVDAIAELHQWFGGKMVVRLKDGKSELQVARERVADLRQRLGLMG